MFAANVDPSAATAATVMIPKNVREVEFFLRGRDGPDESNFKISIA